MLEMHLRYPGFTYSACRPFTYISKIVNIFQNFQKFKETGDIFIRMNYGDFKGLPRGIGPDKVFCDKAFTIATNPKIMDTKEV